MRNSPRFWTYNDIKPRRAFTTTLLDIQYRLKIKGRCLHVVLRSYSFLDVDIFIPLHSHQIKWLNWVAFLWFTHLIRLYKHCACAIVANTTLSITSFPLLRASYWLALCTTVKFERVLKSWEVLSTIVRRPAALCVHIVHTKLLCHISYGCTWTGGGGTQVGS